MAKGKYHEWLENDKLLLLEAWARDGLTDEQISEKIGISSATLYNWKNKHLEILEALKRGKEIVDIEVENALLKRAKGYEYEEVTEEETVYPDGTVATKTKRVVKQVLPDTTAQIFWLRNRKSDKWRNKPKEDDKVPDDNNTALINALEQSAEEVWLEDEQ